MNDRTMGIINGILNIPIRWADTILKVPYKACMRSKYDLYSMDWRTWKEKGMYQRDMIREQILFNSLVPKDKDGNVLPYNFINQVFRNDMSGKVPINPQNGLPNVYMSYHKDHSLFDFSLLLEHATNIFTVSTSIIYIIELLELKMPVHIYIRRPDEKSHENYDYILTSPNYIFH